ncbi:MAG: DNA cytosine methyltransferase [Kiritimatiellae bacterium]|nr:DNA cytosine methyltransferase [Kiritimatiellia bacterium]
MKVLELFSGTGVLSAAFRERGHRTLTVDWEESHKPDLKADIGTLSADDVVRLFGRPDVIWASPDCTTYSVMCISRHRDGVKPKSEYAAQCDRVNAHVCDLIRELKPKAWFVENPVGMLRKMPFILKLMEDTGGRRHTVTYCQYGERRQKPTDIFTNHPDPQFRPPCRRGDKCHDAAPRGSRTGTQGLKGKALRAKLPKELCDHVARICEGLV